MRTQNFSCTKIVFGIIFAALFFSGSPSLVFAESGHSVYRLYSEVTKEHLFTRDANEYRVLAGRNWKQEGRAWRSPDSSSTPVYRLYSEVTKEHLYTKDANEYRVLGSRGWKQEDVAWYSDDAESVPVYRLYHEGIKRHHYTKDTNEYNTLAGKGWKREGIAWYSDAETSIMGTSEASPSQLAAFYRSKVGEKTYNSDVYKNYGAPTLLDFCNIVVQESAAEGVRAEVLFAQAMHETGWLRFQGAVNIEKCNFGGLGAVNSSPDSAATFKDVRTGIRAQVQHLKAYATTDALNNPLVDPRFDKAQRGIAPTLEDLNGRWAVPGDGYGESIAAIIDELFSQ